MNKQKYIYPILLFLFLSLFFVFRCQDKKNLIEWEHFNSGVAKAISLKKPVLIDFYADWCHWCKVMDQVTYSDKEVISKLSKDYVAVKVDVTSKEEIQYMDTKTTADRFSALFGVQGLPSVVFLDKEGRYIDKVPGFIKPEVFISLLNYIDKECYKNKISFTDFMEKKVNCE